VCLHHVDVHSGQSRVGERLPDHPLLRRTVRRRQPVRRAVLIHRRTAHHRQHPATRRQSIGEPLHHENTDPLGPSRAVGRRRERLAPPVGCQPALTGELDEGERHRHDRDAADECQRAFALAQ
jgi:hypothetical protein